MIGMIGTLAADIDTLAPESAVAVADSVTQILIAGLSALPAARRPPVSQLTAYHREQIKAIVRERLRDPSFGVAEIAARPAPFAQHAASGLGRRGVLPLGLDLGAAARCDPARPVRSGVRGAQHQRDRVRLGLQRRGPLQPGVSRPLRLLSARAEGRGLGASPS